MTLTPAFISPFVTGIRITPDNNHREIETIELGGCLTNEDEDQFYSAEELKIRKRNRGEK